MRTSELELRSRLRFLQVARLEGWEVATQFLKATDGTTDDPAVIEARKAVAKNKKDRDEDNAPNKSRRTSSGRSPRDSKQWSRGRGQHQGTVYEQTAGYQFTGANAFTPPPCITTLQHRKIIMGTKDQPLNGHLPSHKHRPHFRHSLYPPHRQVTDDHRSPPSQWHQQQQVETRPSVLVAYCLDTSGKTALTTTNQNCNLPSL